LRDVEASVAMALATSTPSGALGLLIIVVYFLPSIEAYRRKVVDRGSVLVINLFLGWTLIGWVVALAMAERTRTTHS
jgi:hypothetical protein